MADLALNRAKTLPVEDPLFHGVRFPDCSLTLALGAVLEALGHAIETILVSFSLARPADRPAEVASDRGDHAFRRLGLGGPANLSRGHLVRPEESEGIALDLCAVLAL